MTPELFINLIAPGIIIPLGTLGNGLALWTLFFSTILKHRVASIFLITLYLADTSSILSGYFGQWIVNLSKTDISALYPTESITYLNNTGIQYIECQPGDGFVILFVYHYASFTVSALVMAALTISDQTNRTSSSSSSVELGSSMRFDGSVEPRSSINRTRTEPNLYINTIFYLWSSQKRLIDRP